ncbi:hypothetical protein GF406_04865 [candidate division KSB1 bacterium]|nr:hypothetical protein [candidate division KSB1 bacterium]
MKASNAFHHIQCACVAPALRLYKSSKIEQCPIIGIYTFKFQALILKQRSQFILRKQRSPDRAVLFISFRHRHAVNTSPKHPGMLYRATLGFWLEHLPGCPTGPRMGCAAIDIKTAHGNNPKVKHTALWRPQ